MENTTSLIYNGTLCIAPGEDPYGSIRIFNFGLMIFVTLFGFFGNILVILTFHKQKRQTSATILLKTLAVFDIILSMATILFSHRYAYPLVFPAGWVDNFLAGMITIIILPVGYIFQSFSTWTVVAVALDRYIHICHSLKASKWCKKRNSRRVVIGIVVISVIYNLPRFFEYYKILEVADEAIDPCTGYFLTPDGTLGANDIYNYSYAFGMYMAVMYVFPLGSLIFFNGSLIKKMRSMKVPGADGKVQKLKGSDKLVPSLIAVVSIFLICQIPDMVLQILWRINSPFAPTFSIIAYDFIVINSSVNFIIYVVAAKGFRKSLVNSVLPCLKREPSQSTGISETMATTRPNRPPGKFSQSEASDAIQSAPDDTKTRNWAVKSYSNPAIEVDEGISENSNSSAELDEKTGIYTGVIDFEADYLKEQNQIFKPLTVDPMLVSVILTAQSTSLRLDHNEKTLTQGHPEAAASTSNHLAVPQIDKE